MSMARKAPPMKLSAVTLLLFSDVSGGPRKVVPAEARRASQSLICQRRATLGLVVDPVLPP
jgi:hypothetical protein